MKHYVENNMVSSRPCIIVHQKQSNYKWIHTEAGEPW